VVKGESDRHLKRTKGRVRRYLRRLAPLKLRRCWGQMIGVTGSIGKSSTKAATVRVLETRFSVDQSIPNNNTEFSLLCSVFRQPFAYDSRRRWRKTAMAATWNLLTDHRRYEKFVLEMGVSAPKAMTQMLRTFHPEIAILTGVAPVHLTEGQFTNEAQIFEEKANLVRANSVRAAILNRDDAFCRRLENDGLRADLFWYGRCTEDEPVEKLPPGLYFDRLESSANGITADLHVSSLGSLAKASCRLSCPVLGEHHIGVLLPAILTGLVLGIDLDDACRALGTFTLPPGRMSRIAGIRSSTILDSSLNASPRAVEAALQTLAGYPAKRRIAVLGSMKELGDASESSHRRIGGISALFADLLVTVGSEATVIADGARAHGLAGAVIHSFDAAEQAGEFLRRSVRPDDAILVKGSRAMGLERAVEALMEDPDQADRLLVRR